MITLFSFSSTMQLHQIHIQVCKRSVYLLQSSLSVSLRLKRFSPLFFASVLLSSCFSLLLLLLLSLLFPIFFLLCVSSFLKLSPSSFFLMCGKFPFSHSCTGMLRLSPLVAATMTHQSPTFLPLLSKKPPPNNSGHILHGRVKSNDSHNYFFFFISYIFFIYFF